MSDKSRCAATLDTGDEGGVGVLVCERKHGHKKEHRETWWVGKGKKAFRVRVTWKERKKSG